MSAQHCPNWPQEAATPHRPWPSPGETLSGSVELGPTTRVALIASGERAPARGRVGRPKGDEIFSQPPSRSFVRSPMVIHGERERPARGDERHGRVEERNRAEEVARMQSGGRKKSRAKGERERRRIELYVMPHSPNYNKTNKALSKTTRQRCESNQTWSKENASFLITPLTRLNNS